jgi:hypothetical protein
LCTEGSVLQKSKSSGRLSVVLLVACGLRSFWFHIFWQIFSVLFLYKMKSSVQYMIDRCLGVVFWCMFSPECSFFLLSFLHFPSRSASWSFYVYPT